MNSFIERIHRAAAQTGVDFDELARQIVREAFLRRLAMSPDAQKLVLRGSMLLQLWVGPKRRFARDLDFLGLFKNDFDETRRRIEGIAAFVGAADGVVFDLSSFVAEETWKGTPSPGFKLNGVALVETLPVAFSLDIGFGDPVVPAPEWFEYPSSVKGIASARVLAVGPEMSIGWKLHSLIELGPKRWRPKHLHDLMLFAGMPGLDGDVLKSTIRTAFVSRQAVPSEVFPLLDSRAWIESARALKRWNDYRETCGQPELPELSTAARLVMWRFGEVISASAA
jgi:hypothetical protein